MGKLRLSLAIGDYDRNRAVIDGRVGIDGVDPVIMLLEPEEIFFRALHYRDFDICELSLSSLTVLTSQGKSPYVGVPAFLSRAFRHDAIYVRTDRGINEPRDLVGRRIGLPEYQLTANVWARALLEDDFGVKPSDVIWVRGGVEQPGRTEKVKLDLPADLRLESAPHERSLNEMLERGEIDGYLGPRAPSCFERGHPQVARLFADPVAVASDYFGRTGVFPIMHLLVVRREVAQEHPWLPAACLKAFTQSKAAALERLSDTAALKVALPFVEQHLIAARRLMGDDYWPYGLDANRTTLDSFLDHHHRQGLSTRRVAAEELFHPSTLETVRV